LAKIRSSRPRIAVFGHFAAFNFGNDSTLQAVLCHIQRQLPDARITCICTNPEAARRLYNVDAVSLNGTHLKPHLLRRTRFGTFVRRFIIGIPLEFYRWFEALAVLKGMQMFIVSGTGLLTDTYGFLNFGPYNVFKWSFLAKLCRCKVVFLSVGAGPINSRRGRWLIRTALALADFRSYRDDATKQYLSSIGVQTSNDSISPDLAFSLPKGVSSPDDPLGGHRPVIGLGLMLYLGEFSGTVGDSSSSYMGEMRLFVKWLLSRNYDVRLLSGDTSDVEAVREFKESLKKELAVDDYERIIQEPITSVDDLLSQLMTTQAVVATRFHNALLALLLDKPTISISFHQKCTSLMSDMGLSQYSQKFEELNAEKLIAQFCDLEKNAGSLRPMIRQKAEGFRKILDDQYNLVFSDFCAR
jgi:polysaccharide pyruvyl transferase WcaK-like protein